ncbi:MULTISPECIES: hypothetical protein [Peribacillus]|uniref:hypothetical protein n=1 Tax=Peribacillus TaxID=2675229 RepID=UPI001E623BA6|nr:MULTISPECIES: hypothetical protein [Peribacillus]
MKGASLREIDNLESLSIAAMFNARASNAKRMTAKKLYDADKARKQLETSAEDKEKDIERSMRFNEAFKGFKPQFRTKGGK